MDEPRNGTLAYRVAEAEKDIAALDRKLEQRLEKQDSRINAILLAVISVLGSLAIGAVILVLTLLASRGGR